MSINQCSGIEGNGMVYAILKGSRQDGPGTRAVVLFKGCSFSCKWCPNPELQSPAQELELREGLCVRCGSCVSVCTTGAAQDDGLPEGKKSFTIARETCIVCSACASGCAGQARVLVGRCMSVREVMEQIKSDGSNLQPLDGVTFAGGEPLMQSDFLMQLLLSCKALGIHAAVDTSGYIPWNFLDQIRSLVDLFFFDLKLMNEERHRQFTGLSNVSILDNLQRLSQAGHRIILRVPVIAGITDDDENINALIQFAAQLPHLESVILAPYRQSARDKYERLGKPYAEISPAAPDESQLNRLLQMFRAEGLSAAVLGADQAEPVM